MFDLAALPPAPLGGARFQHEITSTALSRIVNGIYARYDELKFGSLSWAYWHALCATMHIAAAHFGAAIESLQRNYVLAHSERFKTKLIPDKPMWKSLSKRIRLAVSELAIPEDDKRVLLDDKAGNLNDIPRSKTMKELLRSIILNSETMRDGRGSAGTMPRTGSSWGKKANLG